MSILSRRKRWKFKPPIGVQINRGHTLAQGMVGCWLMNEGGGALIRNLAGEATTGGVITAPSWGQGPWGPCLVFNGSTSFVSIPTDPKFNDLGPLTVVFWALYNTSHFFVDKSDGNVSNGDWWIELVAGGGGALRFKKELSSTNINKEVTAPAVGAWFQCAVTWTGAAVGTANAVKVFVNGRLQTINTSSDGVGSRVNNSTTIQLAKSKVDSTFLDGQMDHLLVYNRVLGEQEIAQLYGEPFAFMSPAYEPVLFGPAGTVVLASESGAITPSGLLVASVSQSEAGSITPAGAAIGQGVSQSEPGSIAPTSLIVQTISKFATGAVGPSGDLVGATTVSREFDGEIVPSGDQTGQSIAVETGEVTPSSAIVTSLTKVHAGTIAPAGNLLSGVSITASFTGSIEPAGVYTDLLNGEPTVPPVPHIGSTHLSDVPYNGAVSGKGRTRLA